MEFLLIIICFILIFWCFIAFFIPNKRCRIKKFLNNKGYIQYKVEEKHFFLRWQWVPATINYATEFSTMNDIFNNFNNALNFAITHHSRNEIEICF